MTDLDAAALAQRLTQRTPRGLAEQITEMIERGELAPGTRLPTVRDLAQEIGVSVGTVAQAWGTLRDENMVETRRRGGTRVVDRSSPGTSGFPGFSHIDLLAGSPDPHLLPDLQISVPAAVKHPQINQWSRESIMPSLRDATLPYIPFSPAAMTVTGGGSEGLWLALRASTSAGDQVAVETPAAPGFLDIVRDLQLTPVQIDTDDDGPLVDSLRSAVDAGATALVLWPDGPFSRNHRLSAKRAADLAQLIRESSLQVVEDDPLGPLVESAGASLAALVPERSLRITEFSRSFGIDAGGAVISGAAALVDTAERLRSGGLGTLSRILQQNLVQLLTSGVSRRQVGQARRIYSARRTRALEAFTQAGLSVQAGPNSWSLWVSVADEQRAALALSAQGIVTDVASSSYPSSPSEPGLRISVAQLPDDEALLTQFAGLIQRASAGTLRPGFV